MALKTYEEQQAELVSNSNKMATFVTNLTSLIDNYNNMINDLNNQLYTLRLSVEGLEEKINKKDATYRKFETSEMTIEAPNNRHTYYHAIGVFAEENVNFQVWCDKTVKGLQFNDTDVVKNQPIEITGSVLGTQMEFSVTNVKATKNIHFMDSSAADASILFTLNIVNPKITAKSPIISPTYGNTIGKFSKTTVYYSKQVGTFS